VLRLRYECCIDKIVCYVVCTESCMAVLFWSLIFVFYMKMKITLPVLSKMTCTKFCTM
jgi:hypothetical protein